MVQLIIIPLFLFISCFFVGSLLQKNDSFCVSNILIKGYILIIALFQVVALPFMYFEAKFSGLCSLSLCLLGVISLIGLIKIVNFFKKNANYRKNYLLQSENFSHKQILVWILIIGIIIYQVCMLVFYQHSDGDDNFYIAQINTILETNHVLATEPSTGLEFRQFDISYKLVGYEVLLSVIAKVFKCNPAFLSHTILPVFLIPLHYVVIYQIGKIIKSKYKELFLLLCVCVNMFSMFSGCSTGAFLLLRIWQGKAVLVSIILPFLLLEFVKIYEQKEVLKENLFMLTLILWSGFHTTTVGLYLAPIAYFIYTVTYFFSYRDFKNSFKLCVPVFLALPFVFLKAKVLASQEMFSKIGKHEMRMSYWGTFYEKYLNSYWVILILILVSVFYIWKKGTQLEKMVSIYAPIVLLLTFANPILAPFIARSVTGSAVYWRMFWLFNFRFIVVIAMLIYISEDIMRKFSTTMIMLFLVAASGEFVFQEPFFEERSNRYKISNRVVWISDKIIEEGDSDSHLLIPDPYSWEIRQYTGKIKLVWSRTAEGMYDEKDFILLKQLYKQLYEEKEWKVDYVEKMFDYFHVDYVYLYEDSLDDNDLPRNLHKVMDKDNYVLYKVQM